MKDFNLWYVNVDPVSNTKLSFFLTRGGSYRVGVGNEQFIAQLLSELGISVAFSKWSVKPVRTNYFSEYLDSKNWEDVWQLVWLIEIELTQPIDAFSNEPVQFRVDAIDTTWSNAQSVSPEWFVIYNIDFDWGTERINKKIQTSSKFVKFREKTSSANPLFKMNEFLYPNMEPTEYYRTLVNLGGFSTLEFTKDLKKYLDGICKVCESLGGTLSIYDVLE